jgi:hypothetical protein
MERPRPFVATSAAGLGPIQPQPNPTDAEADARITDAEVDGLFAPRSREEAEQRRRAVEAARAADYASVIDYSDDQLEDLLRRTVFNYPNGG